MTNKEKILDTLMDIRFASANTFYSRQAKTLKGAILRSGILLNRYCKEDFIKEVEFDDEPHNKRREQFYTITQKGAAFIDRESDYRTLKYKAKRFIKHQSMISDVAMSFRQLYSHKFNFEYGVNEAKLKADIYLVTQINKIFFTWVVEVERKDYGKWSIKQKAEKFLTLGRTGKCLFIYLPRQCNPYLRPQEYGEAKADITQARFEFEKLLRWTQQNIKSSRFLFMNFYDHYRLNEAVWYCNGSPRKLIQ